MFKAEIRKPEGKLLTCRFDESDYPLVNFNFSHTLVKRKSIKWTINCASPEVRTEEKFLLDIVVPQTIILNMHRKQPANNELELPARPGVERLSPSMRNIISDILHCSFRPEFKAAYLTTKVAELLLQILSSQVRETPHHNWSEQDRRSFEKVRDLLGQNLRINYTIEELATLAGMNRTKLQEGFKTLFGKTIFTFSSDQKMAEAKALLTKENNLSLKEVAAMLGYRHVNHFSVAFKKNFNISPSNFKKLLDFILPLSLLFV
jgi:AraC-like DNA-binding protein